MRTRAGSGDLAAISAGLGLPALDEVRLEQLELAGLALDALLGLLGRRRCRFSMTKLPTRPK